MVPFEQNGCPKHITMILMGAYVILLFILQCLGGGKIKSILFWLHLRHISFTVLGNKQQKKKILILKYNYFGFSKGLREQLAGVPGT